MAVERPGIWLIPIYGRGGIRRFALVDGVDYGWANSQRWHLGGSPGYAVRRTPRTDGRNQGTMNLHREILIRSGREPAPYVDHINRNPLDNRRCNLRPADAKLNAQNRVSRLRPPVLPEPEPRPCSVCGVVFTPPKRKKWRQQMCSLACQRRASLQYDNSEVQRSRSLKRHRKEVGG